LIAYFAGMIHALASRLDRRLVVVGLIAVTAGYGPIFVVALDYARWVANWGVCMMLVMFAAARLPVRERLAGLARMPRHVVLAWILTLIPRTGITKPF